jgi:hypothetical protein
MTRFWVAAGLHWVDVSLFGVSAEDCKFSLG